MIFRSFGVRLGRRRVRMYDIGVLGACILALVSSFACIYCFALRFGLRCTSRSIRDGAFRCGVVRCFLLCLLRGTSGVVLRCVCEYIILGQGFCLICLYIYIYCVCFCMDGNSIYSNYISELY